MAAGNKSSRETRLAWRNRICLSPDIFLPLHSLRSLDYPHFPILSEWLVGGLAGAVVAVAIYFFLFRSIWRSGRAGWTSGSNAIALAVVPYSLLSGDTLFSIPQFIIVCLLAQIHPASGKNAVRDAAAR